jgi:hypothetical protein
MRQKWKLELGFERHDAIGRQRLLDIAALGGLEPLCDEQLAIAGENFRA